MALRFRQKQLQATKKVTTINITLLNEVKQSIRTRDAQASLSTPALCNAEQWWHQLARAFLDVDLPRLTRSEKCKLCVRHYDGWYVACAAAWQRPTDFHCLIPLVQGHGEFPFSNSGNLGLQFIPAGIPRNFHQFWTKLLQFRKVNFW